MLNHTIIYGKSEIELKRFEDNSIDSCVTDPPYNLGFMNKAWDRAGIAFNVDLWQQVYRVFKPGAHLLAFGGTRTYHRMACAIEDAGFEVRDSISWIYASGFSKSLNSLKPAHELILLARKPVSDHSIAANVLKWGTGVINVDGCRIMGKHRNVQGRFPANLILDEQAGQMLDEQSGVHGGGSFTKTKRKRFDGWREMENRSDRPAQTEKIDNYGDKGGASRFFFQAKASQKERWFYCTYCKRSDQIKKINKHTHNASDQTRYKYIELHPTQKPLQLIKYLIRLITPPSGTTLDPFLGSGTALIAAEQENVNCIGIDSHQNYCNIAYQRLKDELKQTNLTGQKSNITFI